MLHGKGTVVEIAGLAGSTPAIDRHEGFMSVISACPDIRLLAKEDGAWLRSRAEERMDTLLARFPEIDVVYLKRPYGCRRLCSRHAPEKGEGHALCRHRRHPRRRLWVEQVLSGELDATFIYPTGGDRVMQIAVDILNKRDFPRETILSTSVVDRDNAPIMKMQTAHISSLDEKIETLNGKISRYLARYATQQVVLYGSLLVLLLVVGLLVAVYLSLRTKNRLNRELSRRKEQLEQQRDQLEQQKNQLEQLSRELELPRMPSWCSLPTFPMISVHR